MWGSCSKSKEVAIERKRLEKEKQLEIGKDKRLVSRVGWKKYQGKPIKGSSRKEKGEIGGDKVRGKI